MVKIAVAGGSGQVAREVIDALVARNKHDITVLTRKASFPSTHTISNIILCPVDYDDKIDLVNALRGFHTVLSFIQPISDPESQSQINLIDACVSAGVKRLAPSEFSSSAVTDLPFYAGKEVIRNYLKKVNENEKVIEYTLFQPGLLLEYLAFPYKTSKHISPLNTIFDFQNRRAIVVEDHDFIMTFTTAHDLAEVVARAVECESEWPVVGGISGTRLPVSKILEIGEKVRGRPFTIDKVKLKDLEAGILNTSWTLIARHASVDEGRAESFLKMVLIGMLLSGANGAWDVPGSFNQLFSEYKFTQMEGFLAEIWEGKE